MRQLAMVMDLNKCLGCQTCTAACKTQWTNRKGREYMYWNNVETHPGKGYPKDWMEHKSGWTQNGDLVVGRLPKSKEYGTPWEYNYEELFTGKTVLKPNEEPTWGPNWDEDVGAGEFPNSYYFYLPRICNHCSKPACLEACPTRAIKKREEDGIVVIDLELCRGERNCIRACPYKKIYFNPLRGQSEKCIFCFPRVERGLPPACARQCVGRLRFVGYLDDREGPVYKLVKKWKVALPLRPDFGTQPNVYYVPPLSPPKFGAKGEVAGEQRIPIDYLKKLFGPSVEDSLRTLQEEMKKKADGGESELIGILIAYKHSEMFKLGGSR